MPDERKYQNCCRSTSRLLNVIRSSSTTNYVANAEEKQNHFSKFPNPHFFLIVHKRRKKKNYFISYTRPETNPNGEWNWKDVLRKCHCQWCQLNPYKFHDYIWLFFSPYETKNNCSRKNTTVPIEPDWAKRAIWRFEFTKEMCSTKRILGLLHQIWHRDFLCHIRPVSFSLQCVYYQHIYLTDISEL